MYRVLIVDDESYVVDWLSALLEKQPGLELDVCRAYSGADALGWLNRAKIDIIITDICMPELSGISLAEKVRQNWPQCKVILLTAHAEFDYAYEAIKNNVVSYILKTEEDEHILEEVKKTIGLLDRDLNNLSLLGEIQEQLKESMSVIQKDILLDILLGQAEGNAELFGQLGAVGIDIVPGRPILLLVGRVETNLQELSVTERYRKVGAVKKIVKHYFQPYAFGYPVDYGINKIAWIMQAKEDPTANGATPFEGFAANPAIFAAGTLETIQLSCRETLDMTVSFSMQYNIGAQQLSGIFKSLDRLMNLHGAERSGFILCDPVQVTEGRDAGLAGGAPHTERPPIYNSDRLRNCLENSRHAEFREEMGKICGLLQKCRNWNSSAALELYYSTASVMISHINQRKYADKAAARIDMARLFSPEASGSCCNAADYLIALSDVMFKLQEEDEAKLSHNMILFLKDYIGAHITGDVSLVKLSELTGYNSSYLSRFFSEKTGDTLMDYIGRLKLAKIRELMLDESLNINEVALNAGFESRTYFNRFIKNHTGMSPLELRQSLRQG